MEVVPKQEDGMMSGPSSVKTPRGSSRQVQADSTLHPEERKRILHLHAEQNRRSALKDGFDQLMELVGLESMKNKFLDRYRISILAESSQLMLSFWPSQPSISDG